LKHKSLVIISIDGHQYKVLKVGKESYVDDNGS